MSTTETPREQINRLVAQAEKAVRDAVEIADRESLEFTFTPAYGMGGDYIPMNKGYQDYLRYHEGDSPMSFEEYCRVSTGSWCMHPYGWVSSSSQC